VMAQPKRAMVTGASRGIGSATARLLAARGFRVVVNYRASAAEADEVVAEINSGGGEAVAIRADVTNSADVDSMMAEVSRLWGGVDVLVHNALTPFAITSFADLTWEQLGGKLEQELRAAFLMTKAVTPGMVERSYGRLVYLSTGLSRRPRQGMITLGSAKAAMDQFVRYVAQELGPHGITANLVAPSTVDGTTGVARIAREDMAGIVGGIPLGRLVRPEEVAQTVAFFAGDEAAFTNGTYAPVNGGAFIE
jgi:NAD(P)-dependent dehydrogenase (short-subunit alcohol dehydrogenase family)